MITAWLIALWWLSFCTALGLCVGSFLNAVTYRLPRNRSLRSPLWSACPNCRHRIRWYDNIPVLSFIALRGRCRHCALPIGTHYLVVELSMAIIVLMLLDAFFIGHVRSGISDSQFGLTDRLSSDWPILIAHVTLFACLLPMSIIDLEHYWVDVRFTNLATVVGFLMHTLWTPKHSMDWPRPGDSTAVMCLFALGGLALVWAWFVLRHRGEVHSADDTEQEKTPSTDAEAESIDQTPPSRESPSRAAGWIAAILLLALFFALCVDETGSADLPHTTRAFVPLIMFFGLIVWESTSSRPADQQIVNAIHEERHGARRTALTELGLLLPAIAAGLLGWWFMAAEGGFAERVTAILHGQVPVPGVRHWTPAMGFATAASGYIIAGALGWAVRIVFTLIFGKEAFGSGDIHLMAAAGAVAGWPVVVLGFFLTCGLALLGWVVSLPFKRARALPLGPWLSLSFLIVVVYFDAIVESPIIERAIITIEMLFSENSQFPAIEGIR